MIDEAALAAAITWANGRLRMHGGGIELIDASDDGHVRVRFTGMCRGCPWKALTWLGTVRGALEVVPGVTGVEAPGTRISEEAEARWRLVAER